jgi:hypothetical protein
MGRLMGLLIAVAVAAATSAAAAPAKTPAKPTPRVFISPSGEPFRQGPNDPDPLKAWFDQVDSAHKGYIDRAAFRADATRFFKKLDENGDGVIDGFEVADYESKIAPELAEWAEGQFPGEFGQARGGQAQDGEGGRQGGHRRDERGGEAAQSGAAHGHARGPAQRGIIQLIDEPEPVSGADFNLDSHITFAEWMRATDQRFEILDANKDGRLTLDELRARFLPIKK